MKAHTSTYGTKAHTSTYGTKAVNDIQGTKANNRGGFIPWVAVESGNAVPGSPSSPARGGDDGGDERRGAWLVAEAPPSPFSFLLPSPSPPFSFFLLPSPLLHLPSLLYSPAPPLLHSGGSGAGAQPGQGTTGGSASGGGAGRGGAPPAGEGRPGHRPATAEVRRHRWSAAAGRGQGRDYERESGSGPAGPLGLSGAALCRVPRCGHSAKKFRGVSFNPKDEKKF